MKKSLIGIGALIIGLVAVVLATQFNAKEASQLKSAGNGDASPGAGSCCPIPPKKDAAETATYKCESCGKTYPEAGECCGQPTKKVEKQP